MQIYYLEFQEKLRGRLIKPFKCPEKLWHITKNPENSFKFKITFKV